MQAICAPNLLRSSFSLKLYPRSPTEVGYQNTVNAVAIYFGFDYLVATD